MARHKPQPMTVGDEYLAHVLDELEGVRGVLVEIRDRLPEPAAKSGDGEPASGPQAVELREPEPVKPSKTAPTKRATPSKRGRA